MSRLFGLNRNSNGIKNSNINGDLEGYFPLRPRGTPKNNLSKTFLSSSFTSVATATSSSENSVTATSTTFSASSSHEAMTIVRAKYLADHQQIIDKILHSPELCDEFKSELKQQGVNTAMGAQFALWKFAREAMMKSEAEEDALQQDEVFKDVKEVCYKRSELDNYERSNDFYGSFVMSLLKKKNLASTSTSGPDLARTIKYNSSNSLLFASATSSPSPSSSSRPPSPRSNTKNTYARFQFQRKYSREVEMSPLTTRRRCNNFASGFSVDTFNRHSNAAALTASFNARPTPSAASPPTISTNNSNVCRFVLQRRDSCPITVTYHNTCQKQNEPFVSSLPTTDAEHNIKSSTSSNQLSLLKELGTKNRQEQQLQHKERLQHQHQLSRQRGTKAPLFETIVSLPGRRLSIDESEESEAHLAVPDTSDFPANDSATNSTTTSPSLLYSFGTSCFSALAIPTSNRVSSKKNHGINDDVDYGDDYIHTFPSKDENDSVTKKDGDDDEFDENHRRCGHHRRNIVTNSSSTTVNNSSFRMPKSDLTRRTTTYSGHTLGELIVDWGEGGTVCSDHDDDDSHCDKYENEENGGLGENCS